MTDEKTILLHLARRTGPLLTTAHKCQDGFRARRRSLPSPHGGAFESDGVEKLHDDDGVDGLLATRGLQNLQAES